MKKSYLLFLLFLTSVSFAQQDTLFFDSNWTKCQKAEAIYYRLAEPVKGGWMITDRYAKSDTPFMHVFSTQIEPTKKDGKCTYYYPNGHKSHEGYFAENTFTGIWTFWDENGKDSTQTNYTPLAKPKTNTVQPAVVNYSAGDTIFFDMYWAICPRALAAYYRVADAQRRGGYMVKDYYFYTNVLQMEVFSTKVQPTFKLGKCTYYYPDGKKESQGYYSNNYKTGIWVNWSKEGKDSTFQDFGMAYKKKVKFIPQELSRDQKLKDSIFFYNSSRISAWDSSLVGLEKNHRGLDFSLRGKVATFFIIEDVYFLTYTGGAELGFNRHSIGLDYTWFRWRYEEDTNEDVGMYSQYELRNYLHADYKFTFLIFPRIDLDVYFNAYYKSGKYTMWYDKYEEFDFGTRDVSFLQSTTKGLFTEPGVGFGIRKYAEESGFGLDVSAGAGYRMMDYNEIVHHDVNRIETRDHVKSDISLFYMRMECFYNFGR